MPFLSFSPPPCPPPPAPSFSFTLGALTADAALLTADHFVTRGRRDVNNRRKVETYICASPLTIKAPFTVRILYGNGANDSRPFCHSYGHFFMKGGIYLPASPGGILLFLLAFYTRRPPPPSYPYPPVHLFNLFVSCARLTLDARHRTFPFFFFSTVIKFFIEKFSFIFFSFFLFQSSYRSSITYTYIGNEITIKIIDKCRNVRFMVD